jgi:hypothetical protein
MPCSSHACLDIGPLMKFNPGLFNWIRLQTWHVIVQLHIPISRLLQAYLATAILSSSVHPGPMSDVLRPGGTDPPNPF